MSDRRPTYVIAHQINDYASFVTQVLPWILMTGMLNDRRHELMGVLGVMRRYIDEYKESGSRETLDGIVELCGQLDEVIAPAISYLSATDQARYRELVFNLT